VRVPNAGRSAWQRFALGVAIITVAACGRERTKIPIEFGARDTHAIHLSTDGRTLSFTISLCHSDPRVRVKETDREVHLLVTADPSKSSKCAIADPVSATLHTPLGTRSVIDDTTGNVIATTRVTAHTGTP
jgi:hypothetical protein